MMKKLLKLTFYMIACGSLFPVTLPSAVLPPPAKNIILSWDYPEDQLSTNICFKIYHSTTFTGDLSGWTVLTNVVGTNLSVSIPMLPGDTHFFTLTASNALGESAFATSSF